MTVRKITTLPCLIVRRCRIVQAWEYGIFVFRSFVLYNDCYKFADLNLVRNKNVYFEHFKYVMNELNLSYPSSWEEALTLYQSFVEKNSTGVQDQGNFYGLLSNPASSSKTARIEELLEYVSYLKSTLFGSSVKYCRSISRSNLVTLFIQRKVLKVPYTE